MIRRADSKDADAISRIARSVQALHAAALPAVFQQDTSVAFPAADIIGLMEQPNRLFWIGIHDAHVAGYLYAEIQEKPATGVKLATTRLYIHQMGVLEANRGHGLGTALLQAARGFASQHGIARMCLDVWTFNQGAHAFYRANGFAVAREELWSDVEGGAR